MKYRLYFEPFDIEAESPDDAEKKFYDLKLISFPDVSKRVPIDENGFPIKL